MYRMSLKFDLFYQSDTAVKFRRFHLHVVRNAVGSCMAHKHLRDWVLVKMKSVWARLF